MSVITFYPAPAIELTCSSSKHETEPQHMEKAIYGSLQYKIVDLTLTTILCFTLCYETLHSARNFSFSIDSVDYANPESFWPVMANLLALLACVITRLNTNKSTLWLGLAIWIANI